MTSSTSRNNRGGNGSDGIGLRIPIFTAQSQAAWRGSRNYSLQIAGKVLAGQSRTTSYDSSPTEDCSDSEALPFLGRRRAQQQKHTRTASASGSSSITHDMLLEYMSPVSVAASPSPPPIYLLSTGLKGGRRCKSETFRFPLPSSYNHKTAAKAPRTSAMLPHRVQEQALKSALKQASTKQHCFEPIIASSWRDADEERNQVQSLETVARQGWSPYSSVAPTPRQISGSGSLVAFTSSYSDPEQEPEPDSDLERSSPSTDGTSSTHGLPSYNQAATELPLPSCSDLRVSASLPCLTSPPSSSASSASSSASSTASQGTTSDFSEAETETEIDSELEQSDAAKLARLHASLFLLNDGVELPLSLGDRKDIFLRPNEVEFKTQVEQCDEFKVYEGIAPSTEEKMALAYLCGLGYRYYKKSPKKITKMERRATSIEIPSVKEATHVAGPQPPFELEPGSRWNGEPLSLLEHDDIKAFNSEHDRTGTKKQQTRDVFVGLGLKEKQPTLVGNTVRIVSNAASTVSSTTTASTSTCTSPKPSLPSPILSGLLVAANDDAAAGVIPILADEFAERAQVNVKVATMQECPEGTSTLALSPSHSVSLDHREFSYLMESDLDLDLLEPDTSDCCDDETIRVDGTTMAPPVMTPPLTTPELGELWKTPDLLDRFPSPPPMPSKSANQFQIHGCRPFARSTSFTSNQRGADDGGFSEEPLQAKNLAFEGRFPTSVSCPIGLVSGAIKRPCRRVDEDSSFVAASIKGEASARTQQISVLNRPRPLRNCSSTTVAAATTSSSIRSSSSLFSSLVSNRATCLACPEEADDGTVVGSVSSVMSRSRPISSSASGSGSLHSWTSNVLGGEERPLVVRKRRSRLTSSHSKHVDKEQVAEEASPVKNKDKEEVVMGTTFNTHPNAGAGNGIGQSNSFHSLATLVDAKRRKVRFGPALIGSDNQVHHVPVKVPMRKSSLNDVLAQAQAKSAATTVKDRSEVTTSPSNHQQQERQRCSQANQSAGGVTSSQSLPLLLGCTVQQQQNNKSRLSPTYDVRFSHRKRFVPMYNGIPVSLSGSESSVAPVPVTGSERCNKEQNEAEGLAGARMFTAFCSWRQRGVTHADKEAVVESEPQPQPRSFHVKVRKEERMSTMFKSSSLPVLFIARTPSQRQKGVTGYTLTEPHSKQRFASVVAKASPPPDLLRNHEILVTTTTTYTSTSVTDFDGIAI